MGTIHLPLIASGIGAAEGIGFNAENIISAGIDVAFNKADPNLIIAQTLDEGKDVVVNFARNPAQTMVGAGIGAITPLALSKGIGAVCSFFGLPKRKKYGKTTIVWGM